MKTKKTHGGFRPGSGRRPSDARGRGRPVTIYLLPGDEVLLRHLFVTNNLSLAIRTLLQDWLRSNRDEAKERLRPDLKEWREQMIKDSPS